MRELGGNRLLAAGNEDTASMDARRRTDLKLMQEQELSYPNSGCTLNVYQNHTEIQRKAREIRHMEGPRRQEQT